MLAGVVVALQSDVTDLILNAAKIISNLARDKDMQVARPAPTQRNNLKCMIAPTPIANEFLVGRCCCHWHCSHSHKVTCWHKRMNRTYCCFSTLTRARVNPLLRLLSHTTPALRRQAAIALGNLSVNDLNEVLIVQHQALQVPTFAFTYMCQSQVILHLKPLLRILREDPGSNPTYALCFHGQVPLFFHSGRCTACSARSRELVRRGAA